MFAMESQMLCKMHHFFTSLIVINMFDFFFILIDYLHLINNYYKQNYHTSPPTRKIQQSTTIGPMNSNESSVSIE